MRDSADVTVLIVIIRLHASTHVGSDNKCTNKPTNLKAKLLHLVEDGSEGKRERERERERERGEREKERGRDRERRKESERERERERVREIR